MPLSTRGRYGLRAIIDIAINSNSGPLPLRVIAKRQEISESYLEQVFTSLRKAGLIISTRGAQGGYLLGKEPEQITAGDVLRALEGPITPAYCVSESPANRCERKEICIVRPFWQDLNQLINNFLNTTTLAEIIKRGTLFLDQQLNDPE